MARSESDMEWGFSRDHSAREIPEYFIPDFSEWKNHDAYEKAFGRLMGNLRATKRCRRVSSAL